MSNQSTITSFSGLSTLLGARNVATPVQNPEASQQERQHPPTDFLSAVIHYRSDQPDLAGEISHIEFSFKDDSIRPRILTRIHLYDAFAHALRDNVEARAANFSVRYGSQVYLENMPFLHSNVTLVSVFDPMQNMRDPVVDLLKNGSIVLIAVPSQSYHFKSRAAANTSSFRGVRKPLPSGKKESTTAQAN